MQNAKYLCSAVVLWMSLCYDESSVKKRLIDCVIGVFLFILHSRHGFYCITYEKHIRFRRWCR